jgi:septum formation protein
VLCSDTTVALGRAIYGKPHDGRDAARMLRELSGATHRVLTAVAVQHGKKRLHALSDSRVTFATLTAPQIRSYVESGEPLGKAGATRCRAGRRLIFRTSVAATLASWACRCTRRRSSLRAFGFKT